MKRPILLVALLASTSSAACVANVDSSLNEDENVDEATNKLTTKECIVDNDWAGSNACVLGSWFGPSNGWVKTTSNGWYGDMRYTTLSSGATATWEWNDPADNSTVSVYVYIASTNATAKVQYDFGCSNQWESVWLFGKTIDQFQYSNKWVWIGTTGVGGVSRCILYMNRADSSTLKMAMDAAKLVTTY
jgi:hypothetical protein